MPFAIISVRLYANTLLAVLNSRDLRGMEFLLSTSSAHVMVEGAQFVDRSLLWNVPKLRPRAPLPELPTAVAVLRSEKTRSSDPWSSASREDTKAKGGYYGGYGQEGFS
ncbi:hypothetical protein GSI_05434 [Ganoderma sinense ZZ0214-1]|uniref:Uncharacterized protein n=1 Tax=Ganoderma sinense ZZ0214-1 TaxID=1077348 RepID=A0A2G8SEK1_9APHY|nr:hypothetical protein GSI_05434 [Ganoderma sinense ZZ0214-1]